HEDRFVLRLDEAGCAEAKRLGATDFEPMPGRAMKGWVVLPSRFLADDAQASRWIDRAHRHVATMPAKKKKAPKRATRRGGGILLDTPGADASRRELHDHRYSVFFAFPQGQPPATGACPLAAAAAP